MKNIYIAILALLPFQVLAESLSIDQMYEFSVCQTEYQKEIDKVNSKDTVVAIQDNHQVITLDANNKDASTGMFVVKAQSKDEVIYYGVECQINKVKGEWELVNKYEKSLDSFIRFH